MVARRTIPVGAALAVLAAPEMARTQDDGTASATAPPGMEVVVDLQPDGGVTVCEKTWLSEIERAQDRKGRFRAIARMHDCLEEHVERMRPRLETRIAEHDPRLAAETGERIGRFQDGFRGLCELAANTSPTSGPETAAVERHQCMRDAQRLLADLVDEYVDVPERSSSAVSEARDAYPACHAAFDVARARGKTQGLDLRQAYADLVSCIREENESASQLAVRSLLRIDPSLEFDEAQSRVGRTLAEAQIRAAAVCTSLGAARGRSDASGARVHSSECASKVAAGTGALMRRFGLWPR